jgi:hypothetical protein
MTNVKLSAIANGTALNRSTDTLVSVRSGTTDVLIPTTNFALNDAANTLSVGIQYYNGATIQSAVYSNGNSGTSKAINGNNGNLQSVTITGNVAMTLTTPTNPCKFTLIVTIDATGGRTYSITGLKFPAGTPPTYSTAANKIDVISIIYDGTNFYGMGGIAFA